MNLNGAFEPGLSALEKGISIIEQEAFLVNLLNPQENDHLQTLLRMFKDPQVSCSNSIRLVRVFLAIAE